jgi:hypothetical protein
VASPRTDHQDHAGGAGVEEHDGARKVGRFREHPIVRRMGRGDGRECKQEREEDESHERAESSVLAGNLLTLDPLE